MKQNPAAGNINHGVNRVMEYCHAKTMHDGMAFMTRNILMQNGNHSARNMITNVCVVAHGYNDLIKMFDDLMMGD